MGQVVYLGLCLLGCFILGSSTTPLEGPGAKGEMPPPAESEEPKENEIPAVANGTGKNNTVATRSKCEGLLSYKGSCYQFFDYPVNWDVAEIECQQWRANAHLASITTPAEDRLLSSYVRRQSNTNTFWIGLLATRGNTRLTWEWIDGTSYVSGSPLWDNRRPSTALSSSGCIALSNVWSPSTSPRWEQYSCFNSYPYVCKFPE